MAHGVWTWPKRQKLFRPNNWNKLITQYLKWGENWTNLTREKEIRLWKVQSTWPLNVIIELLKGQLEQLIFLTSTISKKLKLLLNLCVDIKLLSLFKSAVLLHIRVRVYIMVCVFFSGNMTLIKPQQIITNIAALLHTLLHWSIFIWFSCSCS